MESLFHAVGDFLDSVGGNLPKKEKLTEYNIFSILGIASREIYICRFLGDLLNPNGRHKQGAYFLRGFMKTVLKLPNLSDEELLAAEVCLEEVIDGNRRVDIAIHLGKTVYPIEVKVWSGDQKEQLYDYVTYYKKQGLQCGQIYYLTPDGHEPSARSKGRLLKEQITPCSFAKDIREWLSEIDSQQAGSTFTVIRQFEEVIDEMTNRYEHQQILQNIISSSEANVKAALHILQEEDFLLKEIQDWFIQKKLFISDKDYCRIKLTDGEKPLIDAKPDSRYRFGIKQKETDFSYCSYICIETNLYLVVAEGYTVRDGADGWEKDANERLWKYITSPENNRIDLKRIPTLQKNIEIEDSSIDVGEYLKDIVSITIA